MSTAIIRALSAQQSAYSSAQQLQQNYKNLFSALGSGNLQLAQTSFKNLNLSAATVKSNAMLSAIGTALSNGDIKTAQDAIGGKGTSGGLLGAIAAEDASETQDNNSAPLLQSVASTQASAFNANAASTALGLGNTLDLRA